METNSMLHWWNILQDARKLWVSEHCILLYAVVKFQAQKKAILEMNLRSYMNTETSLILNLWPQNVHHTRLCPRV